MSDSFVEQSNFKRILNRNVVVPLGFGFLSAVFFSVIVYYLLQVATGSTSRCAALPTPMRRRR